LHIANRTNFIERVSAAIALEKPDQVPVDLLNLQPAAIAIRVSISEIFQNGGLLGEAMILLKNGRY
jgi:hypothetical protein